MSSHRLSLLVTATAALALLLAPVAAVAVPGVPGPTSTAEVAVGAPSPEEQALAALEQVRDFSAGTAGLGERNPSPGPGAAPDLTMALRDLANLREYLTGSAREEAEALLRRPTSANGDGYLNYGGANTARTCTVDVCVHYATEGRHRPTDAFVARAKAELSTIHDAYVASGYREPLPDGDRGGDARIDVYLGDIGGLGVYGYCTSDQPLSQSPATADRFAYCVLDEDFSKRQFPTNTPVENLQVTAAHEYFHATQFAYDRYEDGWLLEATAAWVEDEMYDDVDDNLQYLASSQLARPGTPLDTFSNRTLFHYGTWSFFRFLTERYPTEQGVLPRLVLDIFRQADGAAGGRNLYSWQAVDAVVRKKGTTGASMLSRYALANRRPASSYDEGRANRYRVAPLAFKRVLSPSRKGAASSTRIDHLATATSRYTTKNLRAGSWKLRVSLDLAPTRRGSMALVTSYATSGKVTTTSVRLNARGNGKRVVAFSSTRVRAVEVTLVNGSGRFRCFTGSGYSCAGTPKDDNLLAKVDVRAFR